MVIQVVLMFSQIHFFKSPPLDEKRDFPSGETTWKPQVYNKFPLCFHPGKNVFPCGFPSRGNTLRSGLHALIAWKLGPTSGFPRWKIGETT